MHRLACLFYDCKTIYYSNMTIIYSHSLKVLSSIYWQEDLTRNGLKNSKSMCTHYISFTFCKYLSTRIVFILQNSSMVISLFSQPYYYTKMAYNLDVRQIMFNIYQPQSFYIEVQSLL